MLKFKPYFFSQMLTKLNRLKTEICSVWKYHVKPKMENLKFHLKQKQAKNTVKRKYVHAYQDKIIPHVFSLNEF